jgi:dinuclear metal center YbgI/SA1388 family protein
MRIHDIISVLEELAPPALQESYDNSGLLIGDSGLECTGAMLCLDCTEAVIQEAIQVGCNLVIAHHPLIFGGIKRITGRNYIERTVLLAIRSGVAVYAIHTNLDNVQAGVNRKLAEKIGLLPNTLRILRPIKSRLLKLSVFCPLEHAAEVREAMYNAGAGHIGNYSHCSFNIEGRGSFLPEEGANPSLGKIGQLQWAEETKVEVLLPDWRLKSVLQAMRQSHPYEEVAHDICRLENEDQTIGAGMVGDLPEEMDEGAFLAALKERMGLMVIRHTPLCEVKVRRVALCGGSGSFLLEDAVRSGAQVFVTSDLKYHQFFDADKRLVLTDIGHYESERFTGELLAEELRRKFPTFALRFTTVNTNPINYC